MMGTRKRKKFIHEGALVAEVEVELIESEEGWAPYLSLDDARKLDEVRVALRGGDIAAALKLGRVYRLTPITAA